MFDLNQLKYQCQQTNLQHMIRSMDSGLRNDLPHGHRPEGCAGWWSWHLLSVLSLIGSIMWRTSRDGGWQQKSITSTQRAEGSWSLEVLLCRWKPYRTSAHCQPCSADSRSVLCRHCQSRSTWRELKVPLGVWIKDQEVFAEPSAVFGFNVGCRAGRPAGRRRFQCCTAIT